mmetsp:Transcript_17872/g.20347  ORF Transcript_17872/g.20347 Transcript_17872/m.20347 type:complete len:498 (+) Transcript_17872:75-1568(+)
MENSNSVHFLVGNTYSRVPNVQAEFDRSGTYKKIHDWTLYVDVLISSSSSTENENKLNLIDRVSFDLGSSFTPQVFTCQSPVKIIKRRNNSNYNKRSKQIVYRFSTRQQTYGPVSATIGIRGVGGTMVQTKHTILLSDENNHPKSAVLEFRETKTLKPLRMVKMPHEQKFGIELELTSDTHYPPDLIAEKLDEQGVTVDVIDNYRQGRQTSTNWKMVPDSSIACSLTAPNCNKFELVSPILYGGRGLSETNKILTEMKRLQTNENINIKVNKSMGFHVHIDVSNMELRQLKKVCQNFIKYESVIDVLMPQSRRDGSEECERFFKSNRQSVVNHLQYEYYGSSSSSSSSSTNKACHEKLKQCQDIDELISIMNSNDERYYKLNLQNLITGRQPTIEFRQHSATMSYDKVGAWVRFCVLFCKNSARFASPNPFSEGRSLDYKFDALFQYVIKDRVLKRFYEDRRKHLEVEEDSSSSRGGGGDQPCCDCCATGDHDCSSK